MADDTPDDPKTAVMLPQSVIAALREALSVSDTREDELRAEVDRWKTALDEAEAMVDEIQATDEFYPGKNGVRRLLNELPDLGSLKTELSIARTALRTYLEGLR
jgi:hypothetical protein